MKKKIIVLNINKSVAEIDWILPVLFELKKKYKIFTLFQHRESYNTLKKDKLLFNIWNEVSYGYEIENIIEKIWRFINKNNFFFRFNIQNYFLKKKINFF